MRTLVAVIVLAAASAFAEEPSSPVVDELLRGLSDQDAVVRQRASDLLLSMGEDCRKAVEKAQSEASDPEVIARLKAIICELNVRLDWLHTWEAEPIKLVEQILASEGDGDLWQVDECDRATVERNFSGVRIFQLTFNGGANISRQLVIGKNPASVFYFPDFDCLASILKPAKSKEAVTERMTVVCAFSGLDPSETRVEVTAKGFSASNGAAGVLQMDFDKEGKLTRVERIGMK